VDDLIKKCIDLIIFRKIKVCARMLIVYMELSSCITSAQKELSHSSD